MNLSDILPLIKVDKEFALWRLLYKKNKKIINTIFIKLFIYYIIIIIVYN